MFPGVKNDVDWNDKRRFQNRNVEQVKPDGSPLRRKLFCIGFRKDEVEIRFGKWSFVNFDDGIDIIWRLKKLVTIGCWTWVAQTLGSRLIHSPKNSDYYSTEILSKFTSNNPHSNVSTWIGMLVIPKIIDILKPLAEDVVITCGTRRGRMEPRQGIDIESK